MIKKDELELVIRLAQKYDIGKLYLIGSSLHKEPEEANDYDFAISDYPIEKFFDFYAELYMSLPKEVDLIDLSSVLLSFKKNILREAKLIYEKRAA